MTASEESRGKLLSLDVGLARIGVAVCDPLRLAARPLTVIQRTSRNEDFAKLAALVETEEIVAVICGLPLTVSTDDAGDNEGAQARTTRKWAERLAHALRALLHRPVPVIFWDERFSTYTAQQILAQREPSGRAAIGEDAAAAAVILQSYLDAQARGDAQDFGRIELPSRTPANGDNAL